MDPCPLKQSPAQTALVRRYHHQLPMRTQHSIHTCQQPGRIGNMFDDVMQRDRVERPALEIINRVTPNVQAIVFAGDASRLFVGLETADPPAQLAHPGQEKTTPAGNVEETPVGYGREPIDFAGCDVPESWNQPERPPACRRGRGVTIRAEPRSPDGAHDVIGYLGYGVREVRRVETSDLRGARSRIQPRMIACVAEAVSPRTRRIEDAVTQVLVEHRSVTAA